jgi:hypothetical protein
MEQHQLQAADTLEAILRADSWARDCAKSLMTEVAL